MRKMNSTYHLIVSTVFIGVLLTFSIFYLTNMLTEQKNGIAPTCYDGSVIESSEPFSHLRRNIYQQQSSLDLVQEYQYRVFGVVNSNLVVAGKNDFLFEIVDTEHQYNYIEDYIGNYAFTEEEMSLILHRLEQTKLSYAERNAEYLLVIIPNSQTVYSECMPSFLGDINENTRLNVMSNYLIEHDFHDFIDLTVDLRAAKDDGLLYNNTENSLNSLGSYYTYKAVYQRFSPNVLENTKLLERQNLHFYQHIMAGKRVAREAGLADVVENHTVSLSNRTKLNYRFTRSTANFSSTFMLPYYTPSEISDSPELLLQFSNTWEQLQIEPFFSNTFSKVTYQTDLSDDPVIFNVAKPKVVIQFIYENELSQLLP
ncbi:MAG: hypothetical protein J6A84_02790 [Clostridia bacterium]|nr:hypothetical protein [Clostridia bacterium]